MEFPSLLQTSNIPTKTWFNIKSKINNSLIDNHSNQLYHYTYTHTKKIVLDLTIEQKKKLNLWLDDCIDVYNYTNQYIKENINQDNYKTILNYINLRKTLKNYLLGICKHNNLPKHQADYQVKHCIEMYKSSLSNLKNKMRRERTRHIDFGRFEIRNLCKTRKRKNMVIEPGNVSKRCNSIFTSMLGEIKSNIKLDIIQKNSILQFDNVKNSYIIITPYDEKYDILLEQYKKCGIDIGVRTFLTVYSPEEIHEIGTKEVMYKKIDVYNKKIDKLQQLYDENKIGDIKYGKASNKYRERIRNYMDELHNKSAKFLLERFETINIGKVSIRSMISNLTGNIQRITKRRLMALSHYRFRMKLKQMAKKWNCTINEVSEYMTSKKCSNCGKIKNNLGDGKVYHCEYCNITIDRDINASINIYNL